MNEDKVELIKVTLLLKESCYLGKGKWSCTISGKERITISDRVSYVTTDIEAALESFKADEVEAINIFRGTMNPF